MKGLVVAPIAVAAILYVGGYLAQFIGNYALWKEGGGSPGDGTAPLMASPEIAACFRAALHPPHGIYGIFICIGLLAVLLLLVMRIGYSDAGQEKPQRRKPKGRPQKRKRRKKQREKPQKRKQRKRQRKKQQRKLQEPRRKRKALRERQRRLLCYRMIFSSSHP